MTKAAPKLLHDLIFSNMSDDTEHLRVLEFYSGIGGMHWALRASGVPHEIVAAFEINTIANQIYAHNFPSTSLQNRNICGLTAKELDELNADFWTMSPPCQPFTRQGKQQDLADSRSDSFRHLWILLENMQHRPRYIFLENVQGFERSQAHDQFSALLTNLGYSVERFLLSPLQFGVPNSRSRVYLFARQECTSENNAQQQQQQQQQQHNYNAADNVITTEIPIRVAPDLSYQTDPSPIRPVSDFTQEPYQSKDVYLLPDKLLGSKCAQVLDIVFPDSKRSCCFTRAYGSYARGTGSVLCAASKTELDACYLAWNQTSPDDVTARAACLRPLRLRYFSPKEVAALMGFPTEFSWPEHFTSQPQQLYRFLGNSVSVTVISSLLKFVFDNL